MPGALKFFRKKRRLTSSSGNGQCLLWLKGEVFPFVDSSSFARTLTRRTTNVYNGSSGKSGNGIFFANVGPGSAAISFTGSLVLSGDFTIQTWIRPSLNVGQVLLGSNNVNISNQQIQINQGGVAGQTGLYNPATGWKVVATGIVLAGSYHHLAYVRTGTTVTVYVDGNARGSFQSSATYDFSNGVVGNLGNYWDAGLLGTWIDDFAITDKAIYTANFIPIDNSSNAYVTGL